MGLFKFIRSVIHGQYRKSSSSIHNYSSGQPSVAVPNGAGGASGGPLQTNPSPYNPNAGAGGPLSASFNPLHSLTALLPVTSRDSTDGFTNPVTIKSHTTPRTGSFVVEDDGIKAGEIIAMRCWWADGDLLRSIYRRDVEWLPDGPMYGDVTAGFGVHAFKHVDDLLAYAYESLSYTCRECTPAYLITGKVALWGEIVEHEKGYRAEYAKIISISNQALVNSASFSPWHQPPELTALLVQLKYGVTDIDGEIHVSAYNHVDDARSIMSPKKR